MPTIDITRIGSNIGALQSLQSLLDINNKLAAAQSKLSTGKAINSAADDPAGLVIATKLNARSQGLKVAMNNISDAKNMMSVAEAGLSKITDILITMRNKATQAASDTLGTTERNTIQTQLSQFANQIDDIVTQTKWNGVSLLSGSLSKVFQTGVEENESTTWTLNTKHDPTSLLVSSNATQGVSTVSNLANAFSTFGSSTTIGTGLTELTTGSYSVKVKNVAADATTGKIVSTATNTLATGSGDQQTFAIVAGTGAASSQLSNGTNTLSFTGLSFATSTLSYTINGTSASTILSGLNSSTSQITAGSVVLNTGATGGDTGMKIWFGAGTLTTLSGTFGFDYLQKGMAQLQLLSSDGTAQTVMGNTNNPGGASVPTTTMYAAANSQYDTGRGLLINTGLINNLHNYENSSTYASLTYTKANAYSVDVSTAAKAGSYMTTVTNAMDIVNQSMADLGSLMARMDIKSSTASSAQINVESAYNRIMNANMAEEQVNASKYQVLQQTAVAMLAQSNQAPQAILSLFK